MTTVRAKHPPYDDGHLGEVVNDMRVAGPPTIRVVRFNGELYATEGSHRLAAASYLGVIPKVWIDETIVDALPDGHWEKVSEKLPAYKYDHVLALEAKAFKTGE